MQRVRESISPNKCSNSVASAVSHSIIPTYIYSVVTLVRQRVRIDRKPRKKVLIRFNFPPAYTNPRMIKFKTLRLTFAGSDCERERERERKHWNTGSTRGDRSPIENYEKKPLIPASIRGGIDSPLHTYD